MAACRSQLRLLCKIATVDSQHKNSTQTLQIQTDKLIMSETVTIPKKTRKRVRKVLTYKVAFAQEPFTIGALSLLPQRLRTLQIEGTFFQIDLTI